MFHCNDYHLKVVFGIHTHNGKLIHYCIPVICAGRSIYLFSCSFHYLVFKFGFSDRIIFSLNMGPKRKATDAGSSLSPLKKRNAVTAGIGRAADSESNGVGFGYYGRTDDREDVSKTVPVFLGSSCPFSSSSVHHTVDTLSLFSLLQRLKWHTL